MWHVRQRRRVLHAMWALPAWVLVSACGSKPPPIIIPPPPPPPPPPPKTLLDIELVGDAGMNPDSRNRPSPAIVRVYELKAPAAFQAADFFSLFDKDQETLAADSTARDEFMLKPGERISLQREAQPGTHHIAVLVAYRELERSTWRAVAPVARTSRRPSPSPWARASWRSAP